MTENTRTVFVTGLRNAHAMENQALAIMKPQIKRIESYPQVARRLEEHYRETEEQIRRLDGILADMDETPSTVKDWFLSAGGSMAAIAHSMAGDEILKNAFANFAFENYEIAAYKSLLTIAETGGFELALQPLSQNLAEEESMAAWLDDNLGAVTTEFALLNEAGEKASI